ncbi:MAG: hypothetical protein IPP82_17955 [Xanthomonadales bacterium]|nr:hypothetical protein [Xanthomonadales bacterium]
MITAVRTWTFKPERVAGHGVEGRAWLPICFVAITNASGGDGCRYPTQNGDTAFDAGSSIALESSVTLKSDVIGKTL